MFKKNVLNISFLLVLLSVFLFVPAEKVKAQNQIVALEIDINDILSNSQFIGLTNLGLDSEGRGPVLVSGYIQNLTNEVVTDLYIEVKVFAGKIGEIVNVTSRPGFPFSLQPTQSVYINNNTLSEDGVQGISDKVKFDGGLTTEGDEFIESLDGSTTLPADIYSIEIIVFQNTNENGRVDLASISAEIGGAVPVSESVDFFLRTPGDVTDANVEITNPYPQFSWEGEQGIEYRLLVVKNSATDSPESLLESARSSAPPKEGGSLLQFENLDIRVTGESFQYPSSGAIPLEPGQTYFWQLSTSIQSGINIEERTSEIWSFKLSEPETTDDSIVITEETKKALINLVGNGTFENLVSSGFTIQSFQIDGVTYSGAQATIILAELLRKIEAGDIVLGGGN
ncbi:MAG TPA: hypothetical protein DEO59_15650 [Balneola sp.]|jgi:hypothetical protein|nr:hypothetical protein [Balneola sp.]MAO76418.1 hypothetical protein [Balneola sp.]MBF65609.1 hypothetical protein [Balneola sp.]HBZ39831.1 hypothetical protein [Balneola sp.]|tara:strand:+ start:4773 stop:5963 length:1191 start_codon:yes stop_codon:yes gene_type:complete